MEKYTDILARKDEECDGGYVMFIPSVPAQEAIHILTNYLLGEDYYIINPLCNEQANAEIVADILYKYSRKYRKELRDIRRDKYPSKLRRFLLWLAKKV